MKIVLDYDEKTGEIKDKTGLMITVWHGLKDHKLKDGDVSTNIEDLSKLKKSGFTADEIISLRLQGII